MNTCISCKWYSRTCCFDQGECRRHAPVMIHKEKNINYINGWEYSARFPMMSESGCCGDWERNIEYESQGN